MFPNIIEDVNDGTVDHDYDLRAIATDSSVRSDLSATLDKPATLSIAHRQSGKGDGLTRESRVRFDATFERTEDQAQGLGSVYIVVRQPVKVATAVQMEGLALQALNFLSASGNLVKFLGGQI
jgi:hypothetical protein